MGRLPLVSIVIPTLNCSDNLRECLESIKNQSYSNIEVIVVDGHSSDDTREVAKIFGARVYSFGPKQDQPFKKFFPAPYQRNFGVSRAKGKYVYYVDSDMRLLPDVVEKCVAKIEEGFDAAIVPEFSYGEGFWSQCRVLEKSCYNDDPYVDAARFIKKRVWDKLGGLDASLGGGDDWDFQIRLNKNGFKTGRINSYIRHYEGHLTLRKQLKKKFIYGKTVFRYFRKHKKDKKILLMQYSLIRPAFLRNFKKLISQPKYFIGMITLKTFEYSAALLGILFSKK